MKTNSMENFWGKNSHPHYDTSVYQLFEKLHSVICNYIMSYLLHLLRKMQLKKTHANAAKIELPQKSVEKQLTHLLPLLRSNTGIQKSQL